MLGARVSMWTCQIDVIDKHVAIATILQEDYCLNMTFYISGTVESIFVQFATPVFWSLFSETPMISSFLIPEKSTPLDPSLDGYMW
jgi:hypothetical protein